LSSWLRGKITVAGMAKIILDGVLVNLAVLTAFSTRLLYIIATSNSVTDINYRETLWSYMKVYGSSFWLLTLICLLVFAFNGFYTYGRFYRGRYKILVIAQAASIAYLLFGMLTYISQGPLLYFLAEYLNIPRGVLITAWVLTIVFLIASRAWVFIWKRLVHSDSRLLVSGDHKINRVLVIGGAGYIGSALLPILLEKGYQVRVLDLLLYGEEPIKPFLDHPHLELLQADFRQIDAVVSAMQNVDAVIHLGAIVGDPACALDEGLTVEINLMATRMIAEVAKGCDVRHFIFASTCSVYGASEHMLDEYSEMKPVSLYAKSKAASEKMLLKMVDDRFSPVILRFSTVYGLSGRYRFDLVVNLLTGKALVDKEITIFGGNQWRSFVHVEDSARAIMSVLEAPPEIVRSQVFNVGSNEQNYTIAHIGEMIHKHVPDAYMVNKGDEVDPNNYKVNFAKIQRMLGFRPKWSVEQGITQVAYAIQSGAVKDYKAPQYSNIKFFTGPGLAILDRHENGWAYRLLDETEETSISEPTDPIVAITT
jgi:nucleoside-diphosphate-sugar epimerase/sorbitol-specific phosphotransferase system component IIC